MPRLLPRYDHEWAPRVVRALNVMVNMVLAVLLLVAADVFGEAHASSISLQPLSPRTERIARETGLSLRDYYEKYADKQIPVIIQDLEHLFANMTRANILNFCGEAMVPTDGLKKEAKTWAHLVETGVTQLKDIMNDETGANFPGSVGVFDWPLMECPGFLEKHYNVPKYFAQDYLQRIDPQIHVGMRHAWPSLFVGFDGKYGGCHKDVCGTSFWQYVIEGEKEWHITEDLAYTDFYLEPDARLHHWHDIVGPGELLIIPGDCWHQVRNKGKTLSLAGNFLGRGQLDTFERAINSDVSEGDDSKIKEIDQVMRAHVLYRPGFNFTIDLQQGHMSWAEFKSQYRKFGMPIGAPVIHVQGAGSDEVNGQYTDAGQYNDAHEFVMIKNNRTFDLFRVENEGWWNIMERGSKTVHYAGRLPVLATIPPSGATFDKGGTSRFIGKKPFPTILVTFDDSRSGEHDEL